MKKKFPVPARRLPIDFGDEPVLLIPVQKWVRSLGRRRRSSASALQRFNGSDSSESGSQGEGELKTEHLNLKTSRKSYIANRKSRGAFTLVEILVVLALLSLIVFALMAVFAGTQRAFRASLTQTDTLEGGRAVMDLIAGDLETMTASGGFSNSFVVKGGFQRFSSPVNFSCNVKDFPLYPPSPLYQPLLGSPSGMVRTNTLEDIFILSKGNVNGVSSWIGTGYSVTTNLADGTLYPLYRFYMTTNAASGAVGQNFLYDIFSLEQYTNSANWSHLMNGVVNLTLRTYDTNGVWMTNGYPNASFVTVPHNVMFIDSGPETSCFFFSNAVPASVSIVLGTLEDRVLQHAEALGPVAQSNYLAGASGQVHLFTRRVWIRNLDPTAYQ